MHRGAVAAQESARLTLGLGDLSRGHFPGDLGTQRLPLFTARQRGEIEPFMRLNEIHFDPTRTATIRYAQFITGLPLVA